tara:strand:+ start:107 stop:619 length:513 start_codon:yes stop_codon:yes gene_type:complete
MKIEKIIIGVGGNIYSDSGSHPIEVCTKAINTLADYSIKVERQSKWYSSEPIPKSDQPNFFNCVILATTKHNEYNVLKYLHKIENKFGRKRKKINEARTIDLDLIDYSNKVLQNNKIILPHPRAHLRKFVMKPLGEINPDWAHPILKLNVFQILKYLNKQKLEEFEIIKK